MGAWIESHTNLIKHHKVLRMANELDIRPVEVIGHLHCLWHNVLEFREDGDITAWTPKEIAFYSEYDGNPDKFFDALLNCGWIDKNEKYIIIHDWLDYAWRYLQVKYRTNKPDHLEYIKNKHSQTARTSYQPNQPNQPNLPNQPNQPAKSVCILPYTFEELWEDYPNKVGKKQAMRHFNASVKTVDDSRNINIALTNYINTEKVKNGYVQNGSTWFNNWRDYIKYIEPKKKSNKLSIKDL